MQSTYTDQKKIKKGVDKTEGTYYLLSQLKIVGRHGRTRTKEECNARF